MRLAIMQPYLFPYLGYFQLLDAADKLVIYDDVSYSKNRWVNRNRLAAKGEPCFFTVPLLKASSFASIDSLRCHPDKSRWRRKIINTVAQNYTQAPNREIGLNMLEQSLALDTDSIATIARHSITSVMRFLGMKTAIVTSSRSYANNHLRSQDRVLNICSQEGAITYINLPGGKALYDAEKFAACSIQLRFLHPSLQAYPQLHSGFLPGLSILDAIMNCSADDCKKLLKNYTLEP